MMTLSILRSSSGSSRLSPVPSFAFGALVFGGLALGALVLAPAAVAAPPSDSALTDDGRVLRLVDGFYGDLFPDGDAAGASIRALALDVEVGGDVERLLVPGTETWRPERSPSVIWDPASATTLFFWLSGTGSNGQMTVEFTHRRDGEWGEIQSGRDGDERLVIFDHEPTTFFSHDELTFAAADDSRVTVSRHVVHLVWREAATERLLYMPLVFIDGRYVGWSDIVPLSQVLQKANEDAAPSDGMPESLRSLLAVEQVGDTLLLGVADSEHGHLGVIAIELLPISLAALADGVLDAVLDHGGGGAIDGGGLQALSEGIRAQIISVGQTVNLNPAVTEYTAIRVANWLRAADPALGRDEIASGARAQTLDIGSSVIAHTVADPNTPQGEITELDLGEFLASDGDRLGDLVRLAVRLDVPAPDLDVPGVEALIGAKGARLMLVWPQADGAELAFTQYLTRLGGWSEPQAVELGEDLNREQAIELLRRRLN